MERTKGERTPDRIVAAAAPLFNNQRGYLGASMSDLMAATGLEKGGIYRHFASKDALALAAFDHALALHGARLRSLVDAHTGAVARLTAFLDALASVADDPAVPGGCPLLNMDIESDDGDASAYAPLRARAQAGMTRVLAFARDLIVAGQTAGEIDPLTDAAAEAEHVVGTMEGALMLSRLYDDPRYVQRAAARLARRAASMTA